MSLVNAYLIKGFVLAHNPPKEVLDAIEAIIADLDAGAGREVIVTGDVSLNVAADAATGLPGNDDTQVATPVTPGTTSKPGKKHNWSDEARAAQAERMRARRAAGLLGKKVAVVPDASPLVGSGSSDREELEPTEQPTAPEFDESELRITVPSPSPVKRRKSRLTDADWPEIKAMLARGRARKAIASDYDEEAEDLDFFIASNQRLEGKHSPGEAEASPSSVTSDATGTATW